MMMVVVVVVVMVVVVVVVVVMVVVMMMMMIMFPLLFVWFVKFQILLPSRVSPATFLVVNCLVFTRE
jgi:hypothetical protein